MEPERRRYPRMREVVFRVLAKRPGHLEAQAVGAAFSAGVTLPIRITAPTLDELQHEAREALSEHLGAGPLHGSGARAPRPQCCRQQHPAGGTPPCCSVPLSPSDGCCAPFMNPCCRR